MLIRDVMSPDFHTAPRSESLRTAVGIMLRSDAEAVVLTEDGDPNGLITQRKALVAAFKTDDPLTEIPLDGFGSGFRVTVAPDTTVLFAIGRLISADQDVLAVIEDLDLVGIVTREDMLDEYSNLQREAIEADEKRSEWESPTSS
ncbi:MAG: CBS domain-containing protein [Halococcoides sp.]